MPREFGKNRNTDFAHFANLGGKQKLTDRERSYLIAQCGNDGALADDEKLLLARTQSERMYRVCCLMAYGTPPKPAATRSSRTHACMLASVSDIELFASAEQKPQPWLDEYREAHVDMMGFYRIELPCLQLVDDVIPEPRAPRSYFSSFNPTAPIELGGIRHEFSRRGTEIYSITTHDRDIGSLDIDPEPFKVLAQTVINAHITSAYIGVFDGKPVFEPRNGIEKLWQAIAELSEKQAPGVCPVCGKLIDRRRGQSGGQPPHACPEHLEKFRQLKRYVRKESAKHDPATMTDAFKCESAVRKLRLGDKPELNARPLWRG